jgi:hypothetical protein
MDWKTQMRFLGLPLVHVAFGRDSRGKLRVAKGFIAIGQFALGFVTIAQFGVGALFGFGQFMLGLATVAQFAGGVIFGLGQFATGYVAIGQIVLGYYGLCQLGWAEFMWSPKHKDPEAVSFFHELLRSIRSYMRW